MSIVIVVGNETMAGQYESICSSYGCKAKVFTKENGALKKKIGNPDLLVVFTGTVSHKMMISASQEAKKNKVPIVHLKSSSAAALHGVLSGRCT